MSSYRTSREKKKVSINDKDVFDIQPVVYSFRVPPDSHRYGSVMTAVRPPHWLYHDHALGVIWMLFHSDKKYIGITQLQWCLRFLLDLKNSRSEYTGDIEICIQAVQDDLIEQYAKLGTELEKNPEEKYPRRNNDATSFESRELKEDTDENAKNTMENVDRAIGHVSVEEENISANPDEWDPENSMNNNRQEIYEESFSPIAGLSTPISDREMEKSTSHEKHESSKNSEETCHPSRCGTSRGKVMKREAVSITYNEMMSRGPAPCTEAYSINDLFDESLLISKLDDTFIGETVSEGDRRDLTITSTNEMVNFLNSSRQQHVERIKKEIETLYGIERFMENINTDGFSAYVTEDLANRMENLTNEDVIKKINDMFK